MPGQQDKRKAPSWGRHLFLFVIKALPTRGHHIDTFAVCLELFAPSFCDRERYNNNNLHLASCKRLPTTLKLPSPIFRLRAYGQKILSFWALKFILLTTKILFS